MATMYGRRVTIEEEGREAIGVCVTSGYPSMWIKVRLEDGTHRMCDVQSVRLTPLPLDACGGQTGDNKKRAAAGAGEPNRSTRG